MTELTIFLILLIIFGSGLSFVSFSFGCKKGKLEGYKEGMEDAYSTASRFLKEELEQYESKTQKS